VSADLFGKYRLGDRIARGGMAEIYHGYVLGAGGFAREIVVKRILPELVQDAEFLGMFHEEAKLASLIDHPNIVQIFDFNQEGDSFYIVMEYVRGADLAKLIRTAAEQKERLPPEVAVFVVSEVLEGLRYAHDMKDDDGHPIGLVHRDISPANILLSYAGAVKLADFGIAKAATSMVHTSAGILKGKYPYMAPEQAACRSVDRRSDLFSVGIVLYQALLGRRPFRGRDTTELLDHVVNGVYDPPLSILPTLDRRLVDIISRALQVKPEDRYQNAGELLADLRRSLDRQPSRENLETYLRERIPEQPRTVSDVRPRAEVAPTLRAPAASGTVSRKSRPSHAQASDPDDPGSSPGFDGEEDGPGKTEIQPPEHAAPSRRPAIVAGVAGAVLVAVLVLSGLYVAGLLPLGRDGSPPAAPASPPPRKTFTVLARRTEDQQLQLRKHGLDAAVETHSLDLRLETFDEYADLFKVLHSTRVDLASIPLATARELARQDIVVPVDRVAGERLESIRARFSGPALGVASLETQIGSNLAFLPDYLEVHVLAYRVSKVELARQRWTEHRGDIEAALRQVNGRGLPAGYELETAPEQWDEFDVFVLGWTWAHTDDGTVSPGPRLSIRSASYWPSVEGLLDQVVLHGQDQAVWIRSQPMLDVLTWLALHREHGLERQEVWAAEPSSRANGTTIANDLSSGEVYLARINQYRASEIRDRIRERPPGFPIEDIAFAPQAAGISVELDAAGQPARRGAHDGLVNAWLWAIPADAADHEVSLDVALALTDVRVQAHFADVNCLIPTNTAVGVDSDDGGVSDYCRRAIAPGQARLLRPLRYIDPPDGDALTATVAQYERLWTELFVQRGYRPEGREGIDLDRLRAVTERHVPAP
jgi:serine/threonine-protein kinase